LIIGLALVIVLTGTMWFSITALANGWHFGMTAKSEEKVSIGFGYTMAIRGDGSLWAWGSGALGDGTDRSFWGGNPAVTPIKIMDSVSSVVALRQRTFAITTNGDLYAWGSGAIGDGRNYDWERPALSPVRIMDSVVSITAYDTSTTIGNYSTFAIRTDGSLWAWGMGQLGDGVNREMFGGNPALTPVKIMDSVESVYTDQDRAYAIGTDGTLWAWGSTAYGRLGDGTYGDWNDFRTTPVQIMDSVTSVYIGSGSTMAIRTDGTLWAWGSGPIGDGRNYDYTRPMLTPTRIMDDVVSVSDYKAIRSDGSLWAWGYGSIGDGTVREWEQPALTPVRIMDSVAEILDTGSGYSGYSMVIRTDGSLWAWGSNLGGQLGDGTASGYDLGNGEIIFYLDYDDENFIYYDNDRHTPIRILDSVESASVFSHYFPGTTMAVRTDGTLWGWGSNDNGQLGDGTMERRFSPVRIFDNMNTPDIPDAPDPGPQPTPDVTPTPTPQPTPSPEPPREPDRPSGPSGTDTGQNQLLPMILSAVILVLIITGVVLIIVYFVQNRSKN